MSLDISLICPCCGNEIYEANITHNLAEMADHAGVYECLWKGPENKITQASELIWPLKRAIRDMGIRPEYYMGFDSPNLWGRYVDFYPWLKKLWKDCVKNPNAKILIYR